MTMEKTQTDPARLTPLDEGKATGSAPDRSSSLPAAPEGREPEGWQPDDAAEVWALINGCERAAWARKWSTLKVARAALESYLGPRPHFDPFIEPGVPPASALRAPEREKMTKENDD
jgi:hypothetical protein